VGGGSARCWRRRAWIAPATWVSPLALHTAPFMGAARALYEGLGFERVPEYDIEQPGSPPALAYRLELGGAGMP